MRFLLGLMLGAGVVLLLADGLTGDGAWRARLTGVAGAVEAWGQSRTAPAPTADGGERSRLGDEGLPALDRVAVAGTSTDAPAETSDSAEPARLPIPRPPDPSPVDAPASEELAQEAKAASGENALEKPVAGYPAPPAPVPEEPEVAASDAAAAGGLAAMLPPSVPDAADPPAESPFRLQTVWVPFHSRMSAVGFAERLTESLDHPFGVERRGPGRYQVVFPYADEPERQTLLAQAAEATGLPL